MTLLMEVVVVGVVACLLPHTHAQLGEGVGVGGTQEDDTRVALDSREGDTTHDYEVSVNNDQQEDDVVMKKESNDTVTIQDILSKTVDDTYKGCIREEDYFNGSINFINLTTVLEAHGELKTEAEACFQVCLIHSPFSWYLTLAPPLNGSVHSCGCHDENQLGPEDQVNEWECEESPPSFNRYKVYCGPGNLECYNGAHSALVATRHTVITLLISTLVAMKFFNALLLPNPR